MTSKKFYILIFTLIFVGIIGGVLRFVVPQNFNSFKSNTSLPELVAINSEILNYNQWQTTLIGTWNYHAVYIENGYSYQIDGEVTFKPDNYFERFITIKKIKAGHEEGKTGGSVTGKWEIVPNKGWEEKVEKCNLKESVDMGDVCEKWFSKIAPIGYGNFNSDLIKFNLTAFNNQNIKITGKDFSIDGTIEILLSKPENQ